MLGALQFSDPETIASESGVLTLTSQSNSFIANGSESISLINADSDLSQGMYFITWNTARTLINSSNLKLIGSANKTTVIGDVGIYQIVDGIVTELFYMPATGYGINSSTTTTASHYLVEVGTDNVIRKKTLADVKTELGVATGFDIGHSFTANGYQKLANGLIIQWGVATIASDSFTTVVFPVAFPNAVLSITTGINYSVSRTDNGAVAQVRDVTLSSAILDHQAIGTPTGFSVNIYYTAIGY